MEGEKELRAKQVQEFYEGGGSAFWEMLLSEHIHPGGFEDTRILARKAGVSRGSRVLDVCSGLGAPARYLAKEYGCWVTGIDVTPYHYNEAIKRTKDSGLEHLIDFKLGNALDMPVPDKTFDIVWSQDAWLHVPEKDRLLSECTRVIKKGGTIAFTDILETDKTSPEEREQMLASYAGASILSLEGYSRLLEESGFSITEREDLGKELARDYHQYLDILRNQLKDMVMEKFGPEFYANTEKDFEFWVSLLDQGKASRGRFIGKKL